MLDHLASILPPLGQCSPTEDCRCNLITFGRRYQDLVHDDPDITPYTLLKLFSDYVLQLITKRLLLHSYQTGSSRWDFHGLYTMFRVYLLAEAGLERGTREDLLAKSTYQPFKTSGVFTILQRGPSRSGTSLLHGGVQGCKRRGFTYGLYVRTRS